MKQSNASWVERAKKVMPGGVNSPVRSFSGVGGNPIVVTRAEGPYFYDVTGRRYIDLVCSWGALIHGHRHPTIQRALEEGLHRATSFGVTCPEEIQLAETICELVAGIEMVRLVNSGTEACMSAVRLARAVTGRDKIVKFEGHYHGHADAFLVSAGSGVAHLPVSTSLGIPKAVVQETLVLPFNNKEEVAALFEQYGKTIAAVIVECVPGNMGLVEPNPDFLLQLRATTQKYGSLLIMDEVITGFRLAAGGAQALYHILPDLTCLGKIIGGGLPVGAYGGKRQYMNLISPLGSVYQAGTLSGNPLAATAGRAALQLIQEDKNFYSNLNSKMVCWKEALQQEIKKSGYDACVVQMGSMLSLYFCSSPPRNYQEAKKANSERFKKFFWALLEDGVYYPPSPFESCFLSSAHTEEVLEYVIKASLKALKQACAE